MFPHDISKHGESLNKKNEQLNAANGIKKENGGPFSRSKAVYPKNRLPKKKKI